MTSTIELLRNRSVSKQMLYRCFVVLLLSHQLVFAALPVSNSDFEAGYDSGWTHKANNGGAATYSAETSAPNEGTTSLKVEVTSLGSNLWDVQSLGTAVSLQTGADYTLSFWAKASSAGTTIAIVLQDGVYAAQTFDLSTSWTKYTWLFTAQEASPIVRIQYRETGTIWLDDIQVFSGQSVQISVSPNTRHQTMVGFGGALTWYASRIFNGSETDEIKQLMFDDLGADVIRFKNWYHPTDYPNDKTTATIPNNTLNHLNKTKDIFDSAKAINPDIQVLLSSWSPAVYFKSNGELKNGGTLASNVSGYMYDELGQYYNDMLDNIGWAPDYFSFQNEPGWTAAHESCVYSPTETGTNAGYSEAIDAVWNAIKGRPDVPKIMGPESENVTNFSIQANSLKTKPFIDAYCYHLYNMQDESGIDSSGSINLLNEVRDNFSNKSNWVTEFSIDNHDWIQTARVIHNSLTEANTSAYIYWKLIWDTSDDAMLNVASDGSYTIGPHYYTLKHFAKHVDKGYERIDVQGSTSSLRVSGFVSANSSNITLVAINNSTGNSMIDVLPDAYTYSGIEGYQSVAGSYYQTMTGLSLNDPVLLPAKSITTLVLAVDQSNDAPVAQDITTSTNQNTALSIELQASDADGDSLTYSVVTSPTHGALSGSGANLTYTPDTDYTGADSFTYKVNDGQVDSATSTVSITVVSTDVPTISVTVTDPEAYEEDGNTGAFTFTLSEAAGVDIDVTYTISGTAVPGTDFVALGGNLLVPAGSLTGNVVVEPLFTYAVEGQESVGLILTSQASYDIASSDNAAVTIYDYASSSGNSYYVSTAGDDANTGLSIANAFRTIQHGMDVVQPGDTVFVLDGTYHNPGYTTDHGNGTTNLNNPDAVVIRTSGQPGNYIALRNYPDGNDTKPKIMYDGMGGIKINNDLSHIIIDGFEIEGTNKAITYDQAVDNRWIKSNYFKGKGIYTWGPVNHIYIFNNNAHHNCGSGIRVNKGDYVVLENNVVSNNTWWSSSAESGLVLAESTHIDTRDEVKMLYSKNTLYNNWNRLPFCWNGKQGTGAYGDGFNFDGGHIVDGMGLYVTRNRDTYLYGRMRMENNIAFNNGINGLVYHKTERGELVNNTLYMNGAWPGLSSFSSITMNGAKDVKVYNNILRARQAGHVAFKNNGDNSGIVVSHNAIPVGSSEYSNPNGVTADPLFVNAPDISSITPANYAPDAIDDAITALSIDLHLQNGSPLMDAGTDLLAAAGDKDGNVRGQGNGVDIGTYEVEVTGNSSPTAHDGSGSTGFDTSVLVTLTGSDPDGDALTYLIVSQPSSGTLSGTGAQRTYQPDGGFSGSDSFTFKVNDGNSDSNVATMTINVGALTQQPYNGTPWPIPGRIVAGEFDLGGEGVAYHDTTPGNSGSGPRQVEDVDGGATVIGWTVDGEWVEYTVEVAATGSYDMTVTTATANDNRSFHVEVDDVDKTGLLSVPNTGSTSVDYVHEISGVILEEGASVVKVFFDVGGFNFKGISFSTPDLSVVVESETLVVAEGGSNKIRVKLSGQPTGNITLGVERLSGDSDLTLPGGNSFVISSANWSAWHEVTVNAAEDDADLIAGNALFSFSKTGGVNSVSGNTVDVSEVDDDILFTVDGGANGSTTGSGVVDLDSASYAITATPNQGYEFLNWSGNTGVLADPNASSTTITTSVSENLTANFVLSNLVVIVEGDSLDVSEGGSANLRLKLSGPPVGDITLLLEDAGSGDSDLSLGANTLVIASDNWSVWNEVEVTASEDADTSEGNTLIQISHLSGLNPVSGNAVDAREIEDDVTISLISGTGGTVLPSTTTIVDVNDDLPYAITAVPNTGYHLSSWTGDVSSTDNPFSIATLTGDNTITANFALNSYTATYNQGPGGTVSLSTEVVVHGSDGSAVTATPATGYHFVNWTGDATSTDNPITLTGLTGDNTITANFALNRYTATYNQGTGGSVSLSSESVVHGANGSAVTATPTTGYHFVNWTGDVTSTDNPITLTGLTGDKTITANFALNSYTATYNQGAGGSVSLSSESVVHGANGSAVTATPATGYHFVNWTGDVTSTDNLITLTGLTGDKKITANFAMNSLTLVSANISVPENGSGSFSLSLSAQPAEDFVLMVALDGDSDLVLAGSNTLSFTSSNWNIPQSLTLSAGNDLDLLHGSTNVNFARVSGSNPFTSITYVATEVDDDLPSYWLSVSQLSIGEGESSQLTLQLGSAPSSTVVLSVVNPDSGAVSLSANTFTFDASNWSTAQILILNGLEDTDTSDESISLTVWVVDSLSDDSFDSLTDTSVSLAISDDAVAVSLSDSTGGTTSPTGSLVVDPEVGLSITASAQSGYSFDGWILITGAGLFVDASVSSTTFYPTLASGVSATFTADPVVSTFYTLSFSTDGTPGSTVSGNTVQNVVSGGSASAVTAVVPVGYTFSGWSQGGTVISTDSALTLTGISADLSLVAEYALAPYSLVVGSSNLVLKEGSSNLLLVSLSSQPATDVIVSATLFGASSNMSISANASVTFTTANWNSPQAVVVMAGQDSDGDDANANLELSATGLSSSVLVPTIVLDDDRAPELVEGDILNLSMSEDGIPTAFSLQLHVHDDNEDETFTWELQDSSVSGNLGMVVSGNQASFSYQPLKDWHGTETFFVSVSDSIGLSDNVLVTLVVEPTNDAPVLKTTSIDLVEDITSSLNLVIEDIDGDSTILSWNSTPTLGTFVGSHPNWSFSPFTNANGSETVDYSLSDGITVVNGSIQISVASRNDAPSGTGAFLALQEQEGTPLKLMDLGYSDVDGDRLDHISVVSVPSKGQLRNGTQPIRVGDTLLPSDFDGMSISYRAKKGSYQDALQVTLSDGSLSSTLLTITFDVSDNSSPVIIDQLDDGKPLVALATITFSISEVVETGPGLTSILNPDNYTVSNDNNPGLKVASVSGEGSGPFEVTFNQALKDGPLDLSVSGVDDPSRNPLVPFTITRKVFGMQLARTPQLRVGSQQPLMLRSGVNLSQAQSSNESALRINNSMLKGLQSGPVSLTLQEANGSSLELPLTVLDPTSVSAQHTIPDYSESQTFVLVSFPYDFYTFGELRIFLEKELGVMSKTNWLLYEYTGNADTPYEIPVDSAPIDPSSAYWMASVGGRSFQMVANGPPSDAIVTRVLQPGWNLVGNPYEGSIGLDSFHLIQDDVFIPITSANQSRLAPVVWTFNRDSHTYVQSDSLNPGEGSWLYSNSDREEMILIDPVVVTSKTGRVKSSSILADLQPPSGPHQKVSLPISGDIAEPTSSATDSTPMVIAPTGSTGSGGGGCLLMMK